MCEIECQGQTIPESFCHSSLLISDVLVKISTKIM